MRRAVALAFLVGVLAADASSAPATTFDRTYACTVPPEYPGGGAAVNVSISPQRAIPGGEWPAGGGLSIDQGGYTSPGLFYVATGPQQNRATGAVSVSATRCTWLRKRQIPLTPQGLPGPAVRFEEYVECAVARRIVFRLRLRLDRQPRWRRDGDARVASVNVTAATFAVRNDVGRRTPVAFGAIDPDGTTRFFSSPSCD